MGFRMPIHPDELLYLRGPSEVDPTELSNTLKPFGFEVYSSNRFSLVLEEIKRLVAEKGVSYAWQLARVTEAVLPKTTDVPPLFAALGRMVSQLAPTRSFAVVDRFLLPEKRLDDCLDALGTVLDPIISRIERLVLVTGTKYCTELLHALESRVRGISASCRLVHHTSEVFHDRFWIADEERALVVGTSPNGIGLRYALVDYMQAADVQEIVAALKGEGFL